MIVPDASRDDRDWRGFVSDVERALELNRRRFESSFRSKRYQSPAFDFVRRVRHHPLLRDLLAETAAELVEEAFKELHPEIEEEFLWVELLGDNNTKGQQVNPFYDFLQAWDKCRQPGSGALDIAYQRAQENPRSSDFFGGQFSGIRYKTFRTFLAVADELQQLQGDQNIRLPVLELEFLMSESSQTISNLRKLAEKKKFLKVEKECDWSLGLATEFRYTGPTTAISFAPEKEDQEKHEYQEKDSHDLHEKDLQRF